MAVYRFKVSFEEHEDISREIEIRSDQTFEDLHNAIQQAVGFDASQPASFADARCIASGRRKL